MLIGIMLSDVHVECHYSECHYYECQYSECHYAECCYLECHDTECRYLDCHYAECRYLECRYAKCRCVYTLQELVVNRKTRSHFQSLTHRRDTYLTSKIAASIINELFKTSSVNLLGSDKWATARHSA